MRQHASKQYEQGAAFERAIKKSFEKRGYDAVRSAGSHGIYDVWATNYRSLFLIQAKKGMSDAQAVKLLDELVDRVRLKFPAVLIPTVVYIATGFSTDADHVLVGKGRALMPQPERDFERIEIEEGRAEGDKV